MFVKVAREDGHVDDGGSRWGWQGTWEGGRATQFSRLAATTVGYDHNGVYIICAVCTNRVRTVQSTARRVKLVMLHSLHSGEMTRGCAKKASQRLSLSDSSFGDHSASMSAKTSSTSSSHISLTCRHCNQYTPRAVVGQVCALLLLSEFTYTHLILFDSLDNGPTLATIATLFFRQPRQHQAQTGDYCATHQGCPRVLFWL